MDEGAASHIGHLTPWPFVSGHAYTCSRMSITLDRSVASRAPDTEPRPHAVVIGSGFGGLAAAIRLGARGYRVTVLERLEQPGGRAIVHRQDGFTFDAGPTIVTAPFLLEELWQLAGRRLQDDVRLVPVSPFYRIRFGDGTHFDYTGDRDAMRAEVARVNPADVAGYDRFMAESEAIYRVGFEQLGDASFHHWTSMARAVPDLLRLGSLRTVYGLVAKHIKHDKLRQVLSFHPLLVGGNPFSASSIYALIAYLERRWGVHYAMGGTGALVTGMVGLIRGQGGTVRCGADVAEITVADGAATGVRLQDGTRIPAHVVVSNADASWTYRHLLDKRHARRRWTDARIKRTRHSMSLFVWYFGTSRQYRRRAAPHDPAGAALPRTAAGHLQAQDAGRGLLAIPAPPHRDRPGHGAAGV